MLRVQHLISNDVGIWISHNMDPHYQMQYRDHFVKIDPVIPMIKSHPVGTVLQSATAMSDDFRSSEYFNDYLKPQQMENLAGAMLTNNESQIALLGIQRSDSNGSYTAQEMSMIEKLTPHMQRAIQVSRHFMKLEDKAGIASKALDRLPIGVIFVDKNAKPVFVNRKFEKLSATNKGLTIRSNRLVANTSRNTNALNKLIFEASNIDFPQGGSLTIDNPEKTQLLRVLATPVNHEKNFDLGIDSSRVVAALFISTADQKHDVPLSILKELYGLSNTEALLAADLANGCNLDEFAEKQGVSKNTVRNQLKSCFIKTGVNRQADLIRLILSGIHAVSTDITNVSISSDD